MAQTSIFLQMLEDAKKANQSRMGSNRSDSRIGGMGRQRIPRFSPPIPSQNPVEGQVAPQVSLTGVQAQPSPTIQPPQQNSAQGTTAPAGGITAPVVDTSGLSPDAQAAISEKGLVGDINPWLDTGPQTTVNVDGGGSVSVPNAYAADTFTAPASLTDQQVLEKRGIKPGTPEFNQQMGFTKPEATAAQQPTQQAPQSTPQQDFNRRMASGQPLSREEIAQAERFAKSMGYNFDPNLGYVRPGNSVDDFREIAKSKGITDEAQIEAYATQAASAAQSKEMDNVRSMESQRTSGQLAKDQLASMQALSSLQLSELKVQEMQQRLQKLPQERQQKFNKDVAALEQVMADTQRINEIGTRAGQSTGLGKTGVSGWLMNIVPGSSSRDFRGDIGTLQADSAFSALKAMKEASPTGGALGQVTERELELLYQAQVALDPNLSEDRVKSNVKRYLGLRNDVMRKAYNGFKREYGAAVADSIMSGGSQGQLQRSQSNQNQGNANNTVSYKDSNYEIVQ